MSARFRLFATLFALGALASAARAIPHATQIAAAFRALDTTGNDALNVAEWDRGSTVLFRAADKDKNTFIDADEATASQLARDTFLRIDTNRDNRLSLDEFMRLRRELFAVADRNRDDYLWHVEYELLVVFEAVGWQDRNANGRMELAELRAALEKFFAQLDQDGDAQLDATEAAYIPAERFARFDKDQDGKLSIDELAAGYRSEFEA